MIASATLFGQHAPSNRTTMAFIGVGNNGYNWAKQFLTDDRCQIVAVCDVNEEGPGYWNNTVRGREPARHLVDEAYGGKSCQTYEDATEYKFDCVYENGVTLTIGSDQRSGVTFEGSDGWVWANRGKHEASSDEIRDSVIDKDEIHLYESNNHVTNFLDCVQSRKQPVAPIEIAHRSISLAHLGNITLRIGRDLKWDPAKEDFISDAGASELLQRPYREPWDKEWAKQLSMIG